jgi:hypothetical protein
MNPLSLKAEYASQLEACLYPKYVDAKTARRIVRRLFNNLPKRLAGYDPGKALRPWLFSCVIVDAIAARRAINSALGLNMPRMAS